MRVSTLHRRRRKTTTRRRRDRLTAKTADPFVLYQRSVQSPDVDVLFLSRLFKRTTGRPLRRFREDFCGTARLCCEFVRLHRDNQSIGVDLDAPTLDWARRHNLAQLEPAQRGRVRLLLDDVVTVGGVRADLVAAMNFSYSIFKTRAALRAYAANVRRGLRRGGLFVLDAFGGSQALEEMEEETDHKDFTYVWDQASFDPISHHAICKIHFTFKDGSRLRNAFVYDWRLWTLPEMQEILTEAGFKDVHVLWEMTDRATNEGNGVFRRVARGAADPGWIAYVVGQA
ncbi:MAG: class I SAM-dependent methyltransferase [Acidobacteriota bacterium]